jgi:hypothetical protein
LKNARPMNLVIDYMGEGWFYCRVLAVAVQCVGRASWCLTRALEAAFANVAAATGKDTACQ